MQMLHSLMFLDGELNPVNILASLGVAAGRTTTTFAPEADVTRAETAAFFHRAEVKAERVDVQQKVAAVESVSAINAKQVVVKFNTALEGTSTTLTNDATDVANYTLDGVDGYILLFYLLIKNL